MIEQRLMAGQTQRRSDHVGKPDQACARGADEAVRCRAAASVVDVTIGFGRGRCIVQSGGARLHGIVWFLAGWLACARA